MGISSYWDRHPAMRSLAERLLRRNGCSYEDVQAAIASEDAGVPIPSRSQVYRLKKQLGLVVAAGSVPHRGPRDTEKNSPQITPMDTDGRRDGEEAQIPASDHIPDATKMVEEELVITGDHVLRAIAEVQAKSEIPPNPPSSQGGIKNTGTEAGATVIGMPAAVEAMRSYDAVSDCRLQGVTKQSQYGCVCRQLQRNFRRYIGGNGGKPWLNPLYSQCRDCPHWLSDDDYKTAKCVMAQLGVLALRPPRGRCGPPPDKPVGTTTVPAMRGGTQ